MMLAFLKLVRSGCHAISCVLMFTSLVFVSIALCNPDWQVIEASTSQKQHHRHGLWEDCVMNTQLRIEDRKWVCKLKNFQITNEDFLREHKAELTVTGDYHVLKHYHAKTLALLICGILCIITAFLLCIVASYSDCVPYRTACKNVTIVWLAFHTFATILVASGMIVYTRYSYDIRERTVQIYTETVEQTWGASFYHCLTGTGILLISWLLAIGSGVLLIMLGEGRFNYSAVPQRRPSHQKLSQKHYEKYYHDSSAV